MSIPYLHAHSYYSFLDGLAAPPALAQAAAELGVPALALVDRHSLTGAIEFYDACRKVGVQPILGLEIRVAPPAGQPGSLVLLVEDLAGWSTLCRLASQVQGEEQALPFSVLEEENAGLICLSGGGHGLLNRLAAGGERTAAGRWLDELHSVFPGRLYIELQMHSPADQAHNQALARLAETRRLPVVTACSIHYLHAEQAGLQRLVSAIRCTKTVNSLPPEAVAPPRAHFLSPSELIESFQEYPQALATTREVADRCRCELPLGQPRFPQLNLPPGQDMLAVLRHKAEAGASRLYQPLTAPIRQRLEHELQVIAELGYAPLFLIMEEILDFARSQGIPTASRGSASSSLVAHCLGITSPDPVRLNLYFERFLNPARATPPDIDTDLCSRRREDVIRFVYERFGAERVATVATINRFRQRSALRESAKALGLPPTQVRELAEALPYRWYGPRRPDEKIEPYAELKGRYHTPLHQEIFQQAAALIGLPHHLSVHPGGMVIAPGAITDLAPTQRAPKGVVITQFDLDSIERLGLVKIDLLGIRGLTVLGDSASQLCQSQVGGCDPPGAIREVPSVIRPAAALEFLENIPLEDSSTSDLVRQGRTIGCFQIESPGMRGVLREIQAQSVDDLMVALALYRPGPLTGGLKEAFVRRHRGLEAPAYLHPALASLLEETYGVILYQEQVLRIANELAGLSLADADLLRRAMSHFNPGKQMETLKERFILGATGRHGVPVATGERIWDLMAAFAGYGFPKAHAASYAQVSWRAAWCKAHHPATFMAAVLANWGGYYSQRVYLTEARRLGLRLRPPHINHALVEFSLQDVEGETMLFMGLDQVRDLNRRTQRRILHARPFASLEDFLVRVDPHPQEAENLIRSGGLEGLGTIPGLLQTLSGRGRRSGQYALFAGEPQASDLEDWSVEEKVAAQEAILGVGLIAHPLELVAAQIASSGALNTLEAVAYPGQRVCVTGMRQAWRRSLTRSGEYIYFMTLEDLDGALEVVISATVYRRSRAALTDAGPYLVEGIVELDQEAGEALLRAEAIERLR